MKNRIVKMISLLLLSTVSLGITACGNHKNEDLSRRNEIENETDVKESTSEKNVIVVYFSPTGTTRKVAENIAEIVSADIYEIMPEIPYTEEDLAYYTNGRADREQGDAASRPAIAGNNMDINAYDTIILGYPIWHSQAPKIISTFLETYDFSNKTILPFCTSHSSGIGSSAINLQPLTSNTTTWLEGKRFDGRTEKEELQQWLLGLKIFD